MKINIYTHIDPRDKIRYFDVEFFDQFPELKTPHPIEQMNYAKDLIRVSVRYDEINILTYSEYLINTLLIMCLKDEIELNIVCDGKIIEFDKLGYYLNAPENFMNHQTRICKELSKIRLEKLDNK